MERIMIYENETIGFLPVFLRFLWSNCNNKNFFMASMLGKRNKHQSEANVYEIAQ